MEIKYLQVLVIHNREVIYLGRSLGFVSNEDVGEARTEDAQSSLILSKHIISEDDVII